MTTEGKHWGSADGWVVEPKPSPEELHLGYKAPPFTMSEPLRTDTNDMLLLINRLSAKDRAALSKVAGWANALLDSDGA